MCQAVSLSRFITRADICIEEHVRPESAFISRHRNNHVEMVIIDEAERLTMTALDTCATCSTAMALA